MSANMLYHSTAAGDTAIARVELGSGIADAASGAVASQSAAESGFINGVASLTSTHTHDTVAERLGQVAGNIGRAGTRATSFSEADKTQFVEYAKAMKTYAVKVAEAEKEFQLGTFDVEQASLLADTDPDYIDPVEKESQLAALDATKTKTLADALFTRKGKKKCQGRKSVRTLFLRPIVRRARKQLGGRKGSRNR